MKIISFSDWLYEMSIAKPGDWNDGIDQIATISEIITETKWNFIDNILIPNIGKKYELRKLRNSLQFILGYWDNEIIRTKNGIEEKRVFKVIFQIGATKQKSIGNLLGYKKLINIDGAAVLNEYSGKGIATIIYKHLVNNLNYTILGDRKQYFGARKLWSRLSKELDVVVDLIDVDSKQIVEKNVVLHHGNYDSDFDSRLWSYGLEKESIRSVLRRII